MSEKIIHLSPIESAVGDGIGEAYTSPPLPSVPPSLHPLEALERAVLPALQRPPCLVMFSGGRDSSIVLSVATRVARTEGLPLPIPITQVFPDFPETDESEWQELVLGHLRLPDRAHQVCGGEMNLLGPFVQESIRRHGLIAPAGSHLIIPTLVEAKGGSLLTGHDGDSLFNGGSFASARAVARGHERPTRRFPLTVARGLAPHRVRRAAARRRVPGAPSWLQPDAQEQLRDLLAAEEAGQPLRWDAWVPWWAGRRAVAARRQAMEILAAAHGVWLCHPLMDETFLAALAQRGGALGWGRRTATLEALFAELLPRAVLARESKVFFTRPYWSNEAREFIEVWDGGGVPEAIVDAGELRSTWSKELPHARTGLLLHAAWASTLPPDELKEPFNCRLE